MGEIIQFNQLTTSLKSMETINSDERYFEGLLTVQMKDKQGEVTIVDELYKVLPIWMDRGAPISDTHSNRIIGKGINYSKTIVKNEHGEDLPAIKITGKIFKNYELDNVIWNKIVTKEYKGLSFGGATRANRIPMKMKDGSMAYALGNLEHYEVAVCKDPAVPMAIITDFNPIAKASFNSEVRDDGKMVIQCTNMGCYVEKADLNESQTFQQKVDALIREGKSEESAKKIVGSFVHKETTHTDKDERIVNGIPQGAQTPEGIRESASHPKTTIKLTPDMKKSGYQTEAGNNQLGGQGRTEDDKEKREKEDEEKEDDEVKRRDHSDAGGDIHSMYNQNVGREASSGRKLKANYCANCGISGNEVTERNMGSMGGVCPNCGKKPKIKTPTPILEKGGTTASQGGGGIREHSSGTYIQGSGKSNDINLVQKKPERNEEKLVSNIKLVRNINNSLEKHSQIQQLKKIKGSLPKKFTDHAITHERSDLHVPAGEQHTDLKGLNTGTSRRNSKLGNKKEISHGDSIVQGTGEKTGFSQVGERMRGKDIKLQGTLSRRNAEIMRSYVRNINNSLEKHSQIQQLKKIKAVRNQASFGSDVGGTGKKDNDTPVVTSNTRFFDQNGRPHKTQAEADAVPERKHMNRRLARTKRENYNADTRQTIGQRTNINQSINDLDKATQQLKKINDALGGARGCTEHLHE